MIVIRVSNWPLGAWFAASTEFFFAVLHFGRGLVSQIWGAARNGDFFSLRAETTT